MIEPGNIIDGYRILNCIGEGSYGTVFAVENVLTGQRFALKTVSMTGRSGRRELRALSQYKQLSHPNLIRIHHAARSGDFLYYTMDLADGKLGDRHLAPQELRETALKLADALAFLHKEGLLHRDIKPDNLLWVNGEPVLGDIGLMTAQTGNVSLSGTFAFLPPRVWKEQDPPDQQSDLYALAKSLYCIISGNPPQCYPEYRGTLSPETAVLFRAVLSVCDEENKICSADDFRNRIMHPENPGRKISGKKVFRYAGMVFLLFLLGLVFFLFYRESRNRRIKEASVRREKIREEARAYAEKQIPDRTSPSGQKYTTVNDLVARDLLAKEYLKQKHQNP